MLLPRVRRPPVAASTRMRSASMRPVRRPRRRWFDGTWILPCTIIHRTMNFGPDSRVPRLLADARMTLACAASARQGCRAHRCGRIPRFRARTRRTSGYTARAASLPCARALSYHDLRDFLTQLEARGELKRVRAPVDPKLEMTALCDRALRAGGPALLFEQPKGDFRGPSGAAIPVLGNLFGSPERVARAMGADPANWQASLRE